VAFPAYSIFGRLDRLPLTAGRRLPIARSFGLSLNMYRELTSYRANKVPKEGIRRTYWILQGFSKNEDS
jgi:hypothetical protein